jgi:hypothetical protein
MMKLIGWARALRESAGTPPPADHGHLSSLHASHAYLRQFAPQVLATVGFQGGPGTAELMRALTILKQLNASGGRKVPDDAPAGFVPRRYADYLTQARRSADVTVYRHYWELCVLLAVREDIPRRGRALREELGGDAAVRARRVPAHRAGSSHQLP